MFETNSRINTDLKDITKEISEKSEVLNVISNFQPTGYEIKGIEKNYGFLTAGLAFALMILFLLLKQLNGYLDNYKRE